MKEAPRYLVERWRTELEALFDEPDRQDVLDWLIACHDQKRVVLVGAGFSRNARNPRSVPVPLWHDISTALAADLRIGGQSFDPLSLADFYRINLGASAFQQRLLSLLDDSALEPGGAQEALWNSRPEAVITTNFLDTLLERHPRAQPVVEDPDLARPISPDHAQVIYLHGHRTNFDSWVVGRSDYDDLPEKRPMLFARTRQLFAQFPLLVVGYSLTDPDFHLVYRQMVRAMKRRHPMSLAVVIPRNGEDVVQAERVAKKYWQDLGLRIVRFGESHKVPPDQRFVRFFRLTEHIDDRRELERSFRASIDRAGLAAAFQHNVAVMQSAFADPALDRIWLASYDARTKFWKSALDRCLPSSLHELATENASKCNRLGFSVPTTRDGSSV